MRIAMLGPSGSGKSTIARYISGKYGLKLIDEVSRDTARELNIPDVSGITGDLRRLFQRTALEKQIARENLFGEFVSARSTMDYAVWWLMTVVGLNHAKETTDYVDRAMQHASSYDMIFLTYPFDKDNVEDDGVRPTSIDVVDLQLMYTSFFASQIGQRVPIVFLPDSIKERQEAVDKCIAYYRETVLKQKKAQADKVKEIARSAGIVLQ